MEVRKTQLATLPCDFGRAKFIASLFIDIEMASDAGHSAVCLRKNISFFFFVFASEFFYIFLFVLGKIENLCGANCSWVLLHRRKQNSLRDTRASMNIDFLLLTDGRFPNMVTHILCQKKMFHSLGIGVSVVTASCLSFSLSLSSFDVVFLSCVWEINYKSL